MCKKTKFPSASVRSILKDKRGSSYVMWVCVILFIIVLLAFIMSFMTAIDTVEGHRAYVKQISDSFIDEHSIDIYQHIKKSDGDETYLGEYAKLSELHRDVTEGLGLKQGAVGEYIKYDSAGKKQYSVTDIDIEMTLERSGGNFTSNEIVIFRITYTISVPVKFMGTNVVWADVPVDITAEFTPKFF